MSERMPVNDNVNAIDYIDTDQLDHHPAINTNKEDGDLFSLAEYIESQLKEDQVREQLAQNSK
jgi:hypothetical protein